MSTQHANNRAGREDGWKIPAVLARSLERPVAIFGGGVSGAGVQALVAALGRESVIYDAKGAAFSAEAAARHGLVVFSPGFAPEHPWLAVARAGGALCLGELDFASLFWRGEIVAITGTNGKTTLTEFLTAALRAAGREAYAAGNVGASFSRLAAERAGGDAAAIAVCEVSSFQAETLRYFSADSAVWTNFAEDHLERHGSLGGYFAAKAKLIERVRDGRGPVLVGASVQRFAEQAELVLPRGVVPVATEGQPADAALAGTVFAEYPQRENFLLAAAWWRAAGLPEETLYAAARDFRLGRHRLARVAEIDGVTFWNDSKGTNFHAVEAALGRFAQPVVLIAGGKPKGGDLAGFAGRIAGRVKHVCLIGEASAPLAEACTAHDVPHTTCNSLADAVQRAAVVAQKGDAILLSPGFASFDQFRNYEDRGEQFERLVHELGTATNLR